MLEVIRKEMRAKCDGGDLTHGWASIRVTAQYLTSEGEPIRASLFLCEACAHELTMGLLETARTRHITPERTSYEEISDQ